MAIKHITHLHQLMEQQRAAASGASTEDSAEQSADKAGGSAGSNWQCPQEVESFKNGYQECMAEALHFLVEKESIPPGKL